MKLGFWGSIRSQLKLVTFLASGGPTDTTAPTVTITCTQGASGSSSSTTPLNFTFTWSETVTGFTLGDITVSNGSAGNFAGSGTTYTADITPTGMSVVSVSVGAGVCVDGAGNNNTASSVFTITSTAAFSDAFTRADGAIGSIWTGSTWTVSSNAVLNTPTQGSDIVVNGTFAADTNWTKETNWTISGGVANATDSAFSALYQNILTSGGWYASNFDLVRTSGAIRHQFGTAFGGPNAGATGTFYRTGRANGAAFTFRQQTTYTGTVDNVVCKALTLSTLFATLPDVGIASVTAQALVTANPSGYQAGLIINLDSTSSPANFIIAYLDGNGSANLDKCVSGTYTNVVTGAVTWGAAKVLKVVKNGNTYQLFYDGAQVGTDQTVASMNGTIHGMFSTNSAVTLDSYQVSTTP